MRIVIDGDACPKTVLTIAMELGVQENIPITIVKDVNHEISAENVEVITVDQGSNSADLYIANNINNGDILLTNDTGLAALALARNAYVINPYGESINSYNILAMLNNIHTRSKELKSFKYPKGRSKRNKKDDQKFREKLIEIIKKRI